MAKAKAKTKAKGKGKLPPELAKRAAAAAAMTPAQKAAWVAKMAAAKKAAAKKRARAGMSRAASGQAQKSAKRYLATPAAKRRQARHDARAAELYAAAMANPPKSRAKHADPLPCALCSRPATSKRMIAGDLDSVCAACARYLDTANDPQTNPPKAKADTFVVVVVGGGVGTYAARTKAEALEAAMPDHGDKLSIYHGVRARDAGTARLASSYQKARKVEHGRWSGA